MPNLDLFGLKVEDLTVKNFPRDLTYMVVFKQNVMFFEDMEKNVAQILELIRDASIRIIPQRAKGAVF